MEKVNITIAGQIGYLLKYQKMVNVNAQKDGNLSTCAVYQMLHHFFNSTIYLNKWNKSFSQLNWKLTRLRSDKTLFALYLPTRLNQKCKSNPEYSITYFFDPILF